jgi:hypothetical protein
MRAKTFVLFLLQLMLVGATPYADARLEAEASAVEAHLESETTECGLGHVHAFCTLCRALDMDAPPALPSATSDRSAVLPCGTAPLGDRRAGAIEATAHGPRAPPLA